MPTRAPALLPHWPAQAAGWLLVGLAAGPLTAVEPPAAAAPDAIVAAIADRVAARATKPSVHDDWPTIERAFTAAGLPPDTVARLTAAVGQADLPGMAASLDAFLFFTRDPEWRDVRRQFAEYLELPDVDEFDGDRVRPLVGYGGVVTLPGITTLTPATAAALAAFGGDDWAAALEFPAVGDLDPDAAAAIARCHALLVFPHLRTLSVAAAQELARHQGIGLVLGGLAKLPADVATALAKTESLQGLVLPDLERLDSRPLARRLAQQDHVLLPRVTALDPEIAVALRDNAGGELSLPALERLSPDVARQLVEGGYYVLRLGGAERLTPNVAGVLADHKGQLTFTGPVPVAAAAAAELARHPNVISLPHVADLPADVARALAAHEGSLILGGVTELSAETATAIAAHAGGIHLPALRRLTPEVARALAAHRGLLVLESVADLAADAAAELARHEGGLVLEGVERITPRGLELLRDNPEAVLPPVEQLELVPDPGQGESDDVVPPQSAPAGADPPATGRPDRGSRRGSAARARVSDPA